MQRRTTSARVRAARPWCTGWSGLSWELAAASVQPAGCSRCCGWSTHAASGYSWSSWCRQRPQEPAQRRPADSLPYLASAAAHRLQHVELVALACGGTQVFAYVGLVQEEVHVLSHLPPLVEHVRTEQRMPGHRVVEGGANVGAAHRQPGLTVAEWRQHARNRERHAWHQTRIAARDSMRGNVPGRRVQSSPSSYVA